MAAKNKKRRKMCRVVLEKKEGNTEVENNGAIGGFANYETSAE